MWLRGITEGYQGYPFQFSNKMSQCIYRYKPCTLCTLAYPCALILILICLLCAPMHASIDIMFPRTESAELNPASLRSPSLFAWGPLDGLQASAPSASSQPGRCKTSNDTTRCIMLCVRPFLAILCHVKSCCAMSRCISRAMPCHSKQCETRACQIRFALVRSGSTRHSLRVMQRMLR